MHRIDTSTAQIDKFGPGKNGFTNGDPATGRRATDLNSDMWDAVQEEVCTVIEKSGIQLNKEQHDQLYLAIVKIITDKIPEALLKKNNLSDLVDKAIARSNLGLKSAAVKDVQTSRDDTTSGRILVNGGALALKSTKANASGADVTSANSLPANSVSFVYDGADNSPRISGSLLDFSGLQGKYNVQICASYSDGKSIKFRTHNGDGVDNWNTWYDIYHTGNKPAANDVDAVSASNGGEFQKDISVNYTGSRSLADQYSTRAAVYNDVNVLSPSEFWPMNKQRVKVTGNAWAFTFGTLVSNTTTFNYCLQMRGSGGGEQIFRWGTDGSFSAPGQINPGVWTNFDNRFVQNVRLGAAAVTGYTTLDITVPSGCVMTGIDSADGYPEQLRARYRPVQININGWKTVGVI